MINVTMAMIQPPAKSRNDHLRDGPCPKLVNNFCTDPAGPLRVDINDHTATDLTLENTGGKRQQICEPGTRDS
jgi:hypothetical protein